MNAIKDDTRPMAPRSPSRDEHDDYPDGTLVVPIDTPEAVQRIDQGLQDLRPVAVVHPDGTDVLLTPPFPS